MLLKGNTNVPIHLPVHLPALTSEEQISSIWRYVGTIYVKFNVFGNFLHSKVWQWKINMTHWFTQKKSWNGIIHLPEGWKWDQFSRHIPYVNWVPHDSGLKCSKLDMSYTIEVMLYTHVRGQMTRKGSIPFDHIMQKTTWYWAYTRYNNCTKLHILYMTSRNINHNFI